MLTKSQEDEIRELLAEDESKEEQGDENDVLLSSNDIDLVHSSQECQQQKMISKGTSEELEQAIEDLMQLEDSSCSESQLKPSAQYDAQKEVILTDQ